MIPRDLKIIGDEVKIENWWNCENYKNERTHLKSSKFHKFTLFSYFKPRNFTVNRCYVSKFSARKWANLKDEKLKINWKYEELFSTEHFWAPLNGCA